MTGLPKISNVSRRHFLGGSSALVLSTTATPWVPNVLAAVAPKGAAQVNLWIGIQPDNRVQITCHRSEMGQGIRTAVAQVLADELDARWEDVDVVQALGDARYGDQNTDGSRSIRTFLQPLREAGAAARAMLIKAAAMEWSLPPSELTTNDGVVEHKASARRATYGELAASATELEVPEKPPLKSRDNFKYIGKKAVHVDADSIARGQGTYGADVSVDNMAIAVMVRPPSIGQIATGVSVPDSVQGNDRFLGTETIEPTPGAALFFPVGGVAVLAKDTYTAINATKDIEISWSDGPNQNFDSDTFATDLLALAEKETKPLHEKGDYQAEIDSSDVVVSHSYETAFLSHASMEPPAALADVRGDAVTVWASVQDPQSTQQNIAGWMAPRQPVEMSQIAVNVTLLGGAFGRKSKPDFVLEAVELSRRRKQPVRVQWTRENDIQNDYFHASSAQQYTAGFKDGAIRAIRQSTAFPTIGSTFNPAASEPAPFELDMGFTKTPYHAPAERYESASLSSAVRIGWLRSVCNIFHAFGANVFADECAHKLGVDPIDLRLDTLWQKSGIITGPDLPSPEGHEFDVARLRHVLSLVRENSGWDAAKAEGRHLGVAVHHSFYSYVAAVIEVESQGASGYRVKDAWVALDCGTYVNADTCVAQMEGAVVFGLSLAQRSKISIKNGEVQEDNFDGYQVLRMPDAPNISVELVDSEKPPAGVGEPGVPPIAPALSNALFSLTGERKRNLPLG